MLRVRAPGSGGWWALNGGVMPGFFNAVVLLGLVLMGGAVALLAVASYFRVR